jgi:hypothetical protein
MRIEVLLSNPTHLLQPRIVRPPCRSPRGSGELGFEERPQPAKAIGGATKIRGNPEVGKAAVPLLTHQARVLQEAKMARHAGLGNSKDPRQLGDIQPLGVEQTQDSQAGVVAKQPKEGGAVHRIYEST